MQSGELLQCCQGSQGSGGIRVAANAIGLPAADGQMLQRRDAGNG